MSHSKEAAKWGPGPQAACESSFCRQEPGLFLLPSQRGRHGLGGEGDTESLPRAPGRAKPGCEEAQVTSAAPPLPRELPAEMPEFRRLCWKA